MQVNQAVPVGEGGLPAAEPTQEGETVLAMEVVRFRFSLLSLIVRREARINFDGFRVQPYIDYRVWGPNANLPENAGVGIETDNVVIYFVRACLFVRRVCLSSLETILPRMPE